SVLVDFTHRVEADTAVRANLFHELFPVREDFQTGLNPLVLLRPIAALRVNTDHIPGVAVFTVVQERLRPRGEHLAGVLTQNLGRINTGRTLARDGDSNQPTLVGLHRGGGNAFTQYNLVHSSTILP